MKTESYKKPPNSRRILLGLALMIAVGLTVAFLYKERFRRSTIQTTSQNQIASRENSSVASDFQVYDLQGNQISLADFRGNLVILDFWATWCGPCRAEFEHLKKWVDRRQKEGKWQNLALLAVNVNEDATVVSRFLQENQLPFTFLLDRDGSASRQFKVTLIPALYVIDPAGAIVKSQIGLSSNLAEMLDELVEKVGKTKS